MRGVCVDSFDGLILSDTRALAIKLNKSNEGSKGSDATLWENKK